MGLIYSSFTAERYHGKNIFICARLSGIVHQRAFLIHQQTKIYLDQMKNNQLQNLSFSVHYRDRFLIESDSRDKQPILKVT